MPCPRQAAPKRRGLPWRGQTKDLALSKIIPNFDTSFEIEFPTRGKIRKGNYENSLFDDIVYEEVVKSVQQQSYYYANSPDAYEGSVAWRNDDLEIIRNKFSNFNKGKKVLILQDSFGLYTSTYLSQGLDEVHLVYLPKFNGSIRAYIKDIKPDVVLMLYNESVARKYVKEQDSNFFSLD